METRTFILVCACLCMDVISSASAWADDDPRAQLFLTEPCSGENITPKQLLTRVEHPPVIKNLGTLYHYARTMRCFVEDGRVVTDQCTPWTYVGPIRYSSIVGMWADNSAMIFFSNLDQTGHPTTAPDKAAVLAQDYRDEWRSFPLLHDPLEFFPDMPGMDQIRWMNIRVPKNATKVTGSCLRARGTSEALIVGDAARNKYKVIIAQLLLGELQ